MLGDKPTTQDIEHITKMLKTKIIIDTSIEDAPNEWGRQILISYQHRLVMDIMASVAPFLSKQERKVP